MIATAATSSDTTTFRVAVYGGTFDAGQRAAGGFRVVAHLPYEAVPSVTGASR